MDLPELTREDILSLAQPLIKRGNKSKEEIFKEYAKLATEDSIEGRLYDLLSKLESRNPSADSIFARVGEKVPAAVRFVKAYEWLCQIYQPPETMTPFENAFSYLRAGQNDRFLGAIKEFGDDWMSVTFSGAFTNRHFKDWRRTVLHLVETQEMEEAQKNLYLALAGVEEGCRAFERTFFDKIWSKLYCLLCSVKAEDAVSLKGAYSGGITPMEKALEAILSKDFDALYQIADLPLVFRVHVGAIYEAPNLELLNQYIDYLCEHRMIGIIIFYASLAPKEDALEITSRVLSGMIEPEKKPLELAEQFGVKPIDVATAIFDKLVMSGKDDIEDGIEPAELLARKTAAIRWLEFVSGSEEIHHEKVRLLIRHVAIDGEIDGAQHIFDKFTSVFDDHPKEKECWQCLFAAEKAYNDWAEGKASAGTAEKALLGVLQYPSGWMKDCEGVPIELGRLYIPRIAQKLHRVYVADNNLEAALGVTTLICSTSEQLETYFTREDMKSFLTDICKPTMITARFQ